MELSKAEELFNYNPDTGIFTRKVTRAMKKEGEIVGSLTSDGYLSVYFDKQNHKLHRLAWLLSYGSYPVNLVIDHINGIRTDNRLSNLRVATVAENLYNSKMYTNNTSKVKGVSFHKSTGKWRAYITVNTITKHLGLFSTIEEASAVVDAARQTEHKEFYNKGQGDFVDVREVMLKMSII